VSHRSEVTSLNFLIVDKNRLLPLAGRLVGAVNATCPATGPPLSFQQLATGSLDTTLPRLWLFCIINPINELVATKWRQALPKRKGFRIRSKLEFSSSKRSRKREAGQALLN